MFTTYQVPPQSSQHQKTSAPSLNVWFAKFRRTAERVISNAAALHTTMTARLHGKRAGKSLNAA